MKQVIIRKRIIFEEKPKIKQTIQALEQLNKILNEEGSTDENNECEVFYERINEDGKYYLAWAAEGTGIRPENKDEKKARLIKEKEEKRINERNKKYWEKRDREIAENRQKRLKEEMKMIQKELSKKG